MSLGTPAKLRKLQRALYVTAKQDPARRFHVLYDKVPMATQLEQIRDQQQATWDKFSAGWKKWDELVLGWLADVGTELLDGARLQPDFYVLDIASGTGEPALSAASRCPQGKVMMLLRRYSCQ